MSEETAYREMRTKLDNMGPVNMMALEEFKETEQRHQFLETQRKDLLDSIAKHLGHHQGNRRNSHGRNSRKPLNGSTKTFQINLPQTVWRRPAFMRLNRRTQQRGKRH